MKRKAMLIGILLLLAAGTVLAAPPNPPATTWFYDGFEGTLNGDPANGGYTSLNAWPHWGDMIIYEWGTQWGSGTQDLAVRHHLSSTDPVKHNACAGENYASWMGINTASYHAAGVQGKGVQTQTAYATGIPPSPIGWAAAQDVPPGAAAGGYDVQVLHCKIRRPGGNDLGQMINPWYHAGIYLIDDSPPSPSGNPVIMGWEGGSSFMRSQVHLPPSGSTLYPNNTTPEGTDFSFWIGGSYNNDCHTFDAYYYPKAVGSIPAGTVRFFVDGTQLGPDMNAGADRIGNSIYVRDFVWNWAGDWHIGDPMALDELSVGTTETPVVTSPTGNAIITGDHPTINWTHAVSGGTGMTGYQVRVRAAGVPTGTAAYDSGLVSSGVAASHTLTSALPLSTRFWAFVREQYGTRWTPWSAWDLAATGGFTITTAGPPVVSVSSPSGASVGLRPSVIFTGGIHDQFEVKITTVGDGSGVVWNLLAPSSNKWGASCPQLLDTSTQYYAFARAHNGDGWGAWSAASPFTVTHAGEGTDYRGMDETWGAQTVYDHDAPAPDDGFAAEMGPGMNWINMKWQVLPSPFAVPPDNTPRDWWPSDCAGMLRDCTGVFIIPPIPDRTAPSYVYDLWDVGYGLSDNSLKQHKIANLSLDKGVTFITSASGHCYEGGGCGSYELSSRHIAAQANIYICDDYPTGKCMASFRYGQGQAGICSNGSTWNLASFTDDQHNPDPRPGQGWHTVRITGRNAIVGDPTTTVWKYYLDENTTPLIDTSATPGSIDQSVAPGMTSGAIVDSIGIGLATGGLVGNWQWDYTAVNTDGDYLPGEWFGGPDGVTYPTISAAVAAHATGPITITGEAVITGVNRDALDNQLGFSMQDVNTQDHAGLYITSTASNNVVEGNKVSGIAGNMTYQNGVGATLQSAAFTASTNTAEYPPLAMSQKSLQGYRTPPVAGLQNAGKFVRMTGRVTAWLPNALGIPVIYLDDGSGLVDGRSVYGNPSALGIRIVTNQFFDGPGAVGKYYRVDGISTCETWTEGATTKTVETLLAPRLEEIPEP